MPKRPHIDWTQEELQGLSDAALLGRLGDAKEAEAAADAPGMGRSVKGRRLATHPTPRQRLADRSAGPHAGRGSRLATSSAWRVCWPGPRGAASATAAPNRLTC